MKSVSFSSKAEKQKVSRDQALRVARQLGCRGAHEVDGSWMPCNSHEEFEAIRKSKGEYLKVGAKHRFVASPEIAHRNQRFESKSAEYYVDRRMALEASKRNGCSTVRVVNLGGVRYYAPCITTDRFERLTESPVVGIDTLPDGGLVSGAIGGKQDDETEIDSKGFVNFVSRSTDPDVFSDPDSARVRARNLGCIGIRRYTARDGKTVWLPCSNGSDYNRAMNIRGDNSPRGRRRGQRAGKGITDSLMSMKEINRPKRKTPSVDSDAMNILAVRVRKHNADAKKPEYRTNLRDVKTVYLRGLAVGDEKEAMSRVATFLRAMASDKPMPRGQRLDFDLVPATHPSKDPKFAKKDGDFDNGEFGLKYKGGCCPSVVKRYRKL